MFWKICTLTQSDLWQRRRQHDSAAIAVFVGCAVLWVNRVRSEIRVAERIS
jgi:hypothetical protein